MDKAIELKNISKTYNEKYALDDISLEIGKGRVVGILGPNGSGKSTLLKIMAGVVKANKGDVLVFGQKRNVESKNRIGFLPDSPYLHESLRVSEIIEVYSDFFDSFDKGLMEKYIDYIHLDKKAKISSLSKGDNSKLGLCLNLARKAEIYIFDEPLAGVDPTSQAKLINILIDMIDGDRTFIISTHEIDEFENLFDDVVFLNEGEVDLISSAEDLRDREQMDIKSYYDIRYVG